MGNRFNLLLLALFIVFTSSCEKMDYSDRNTIDEVERYFIITVDTEGDNGWNYHRGEDVHTENALYLPRFQELCNKYGYKPVYLTTYEMICDDRFAKFAKTEQDQGHCEVGIHVHAWNTPPLYLLPKYENDQSFLIEYPKNIMRSKFRITYDIIKEKMGQPPVSHRAGRWVMNEEYFQILKENDILVDCSYTPGVDWTNTMGAFQVGPDYSHTRDIAHWIDKILEVPVTIIDTKEKIHIGIRHRIKLLLQRKKIPNKLIWLRPACSSLEQMKELIDTYYLREDIDFVEFMIHSSELMPMGSPYFDTEEDIENLFVTINELFSYAKRKGYQGCTLTEYYERQEK